MAKFRKRPVVIDAVRWFKLGDHEAVQEYRYENGDCDGVCSDCKNELAYHGRIVQPEIERLVCPGDWIVAEAGIHYPVKPAAFDGLFNPDNPPPSTPVTTIEPGVWIHSKTGNRYTVTGIRWESTNGRPRIPLVDYLSLTTGAPCSREAWEFIELIDPENGSPVLVPRFVRMNPQPSPHAKDPTKP